jgi:hypothetical protein
MHKISLFVLDLKKDAPDLSGALPNMQTVVIQP